MRNLTNLEFSMTYCNTSGSNSAINFTVPENYSLNPIHCKHLLGEGFTPDEINQLISWGVRSIDSKEAAKLGFTGNTGGIYFPFTDSFGQLRCDNPPIRKGKPCKYLTPFGKGSQHWVPRDLPFPKVCTEGHKDAAAGTLHGGIPTMAIAGVSHYRKALAKDSGITIVFDSDGWVNPQVFSCLVAAADWTKGKIQLIPEIEGEPKAGLCEYFKAGHTPDDYAKLIDSAYKIKQFLLELPNHWKSIEAVKVSRILRTVFSLAINHLSPAETRQLAAICKAVLKPQNVPAPVVDEELKRSQKILAKQLKNKQSKAARERFKNELDLTAFGICPDECAPDTEIPVLLEALGTLNRQVGKDLRLNRLTSKIEYQGQEIDPNYYQIFVTGFFQQNISKDLATQVLSLLAEKNSYHPAQEYFETLWERYGNSTLDLLDQPATRLLKTSNPLYDTFLRKTLIAIVSRVFEPGCKFDTVLLLKGDQGLLKSTFFETLMPIKTWFSDALGSEVEKPDQQALLARCVVMEWAEFDRISSAREAAALKAFITRKVDTYRKPYAFAAVDHPRQSILVGSVNKAEFLNDSTGDRRYWVIEVDQKIDTLAVDLERDQLLAAAVAAYKLGEVLYLTPEEEALSAQNNTQYRIQDAWLPTIEQWLADKSNTLAKDNDPLADWVTVGKILEDCLGIEHKHQKNYDRDRVEKVLKSLGWEKSTSEQVRLSNSTQPQRRAWRLALTVPDTAPTPDPQITQIEPKSVQEKQILDLGEWEVSTSDPKISPTHRTADGIEFQLDRYFGQGRFAAGRTVDGTLLAKIEVSTIEPIGGIAA